MKVYRVLKRFGLNRLPEEFLKQEKKIKKFKNYGIGFVHIDVLYAPKINKRRSYIFTAIDRVSRLAFIKLEENKRKEAAVEFLKQAINFYPFKINFILTDNGGEFTHKALPFHIKPKKPHPFTDLCKKEKIKHRTIRFKHPWTNGMIERFNQTLKRKVLQKFLFYSIFHLKQKLVEFINDYNFNRKLKVLNYNSPIQFLKNNYKIMGQRIVI